MILKKLLSWWVVTDPLPPKVDVIALISYGAAYGRLTHGSELTTRKAEELLKQYPSARLIFGEFSRNSKYGWERKVKTARLVGSIFFVGPVSSTTDECEAILSKTALDEHIVVVCEGSHSRRCRVVWKHFGIGRSIYFVSIDPRHAADFESPMLLQTAWPIWLIFNMIFLPLYKWLPGVSWFAKRNFSQPTI